MPQKKQKIIHKHLSVNKDFCTKNILFPGQYGPTCWFNALLLCILYSQRSRKKMLKISKTWNMNIKLYRLFYYILWHKYVKTQKSQKDVKFFENVDPEVILKLLYQYDSTSFMLKDYKSGSYPIIYLRSMYEFWDYLV